MKSKLLFLLVAVRTDSSRFQAILHRVVRELKPHQKELDDDALVQLALALEGLGRGAEAIQVLEGRNLAASANQDLDAVGVLAGRMKRRWLAERRKADAERARQLYADGFAVAETRQQHDDAFYLGINVTFMDLALAKTVQRPK